MKTQQEKGPYDRFDKIVDRFDEKLDDTKERVKDKANEYATKGMVGAESALDSLSDFSQRITHRVEEAVNKGIKQVKATSHEAEVLVKKYPLYTVAGAVAISFAAGLIYGKMSSKR